MIRSLSTVRTAACLAIAVMLLGACGSGTTTASPAASNSTAQVPTEDLPVLGGEEDPGDPSVTDEPAPAPGPLGTRAVVRVVGTRPHDQTAFTQGLEFDGAQLYESRGLYSGDEPIILTEIDPADGTTIREVARPAAPDVFAEGLTVVGDRLIQLTWRELTAFVYDTATLERVGEFTYTGEGWGICDQPDRFVMSNGTPILTHRDLDTFQPLREVEVTLDGAPVDDLNELECVGDAVWANVWNTNRIVVIDPDTGAVTTLVDASTIADERGRLLEDPGGPGAVLNGIAYDELTDTWLLTGKQWPVMYEVEFDCVEGCAPRATPTTHYVRPEVGRAT